MFAQAPLSKPRASCRTKRPPAGPSAQQTNLPRPASTDTGNLQRSPSARVALAPTSSDAPDAGVIEGLRCLPLTRRYAGEIIGILIWFVRLSLLTGLALGVIGSAHGCVTGLLRARSGKLPVKVDLIKLIRPSFIFHGCAPRMPKTPLLDAHDIV